MHLWLRWLSIGVGVAAFSWMSVEDTSTLPVATLGVLIALCGVSLWLLNQPDWQPSALVLCLTGGLIGALGALVTVVLMFLKTAWHSHITPDYPPLMMLAMLERAPVWALAGLCLGGAVALLWPLVKRQPEAILPAQQRPHHNDGL